MRPTPVKEWALQNNIPVWETGKADDALAERLREDASEVYVVVAFGIILPDNILNIPKYGIVNIHPSLLPKYRGPSPIRSAILNDDKDMGITIMKIDEKMDHGPIITQEKYTPEKWPPNALSVEEHLFARGGSLLADILPKYTEGAIIPTPQDDSKATYCKLFKKEDGHINLTDNPYTNLLKIHAYAQWPGTFFFTEDKKRVKIVSAHLSEDAEKLILDEVIPEGKNKMKYSDFLKVQS